MLSHGAATDGATATHSRYPELAGRFAVVAGATGEMGLGIVRALAAQRVNILLNSFDNPAEAERIRTGLSREYGVAAACIPADLRNPKAASVLAMLAMNAFGHIDILVNDAGLWHPAPRETVPRELRDAAPAVSLSAAFHLTWIVIRGMREQGWGRIINVAPSPLTATSAAAGPCLIELTRAAAAEGAGHGVTCNAICPTRVVTAEELGAFAVFLCSDAAASVTGATFPMNGGR